MKERIIKYEELLGQPISRRFNAMEFPSESNLKYSRKIRGGKSQSYFFRIPGPLLDCVPVPLPAYREKRRFSYLYLTMLLALVVKWILDCTVNLLCGKEERKLSPYSH